MTSYVISSHAQKRMAQRGIAQDAIDIAIEFGRVLYIRKATIFFFGEKEKIQFAKYAKSQKLPHPDWSKYLNVHVVVSGSTILTTYKSKHPNLRD